MLATAGAFAASPEEAYLAARDRATASLTPAAVGKNQDAAIKRHDKALAELEGMLKPIVGPFSAPGFSPKGKINLVTLFPDDEGSGMLDGIVYGADSDTSVVVTTVTLLDKWLASHPQGRTEGALPTSAAEAVKSADFYSQATISDAAAADYGDLPVVVPAGSKFAHAMLALVGNGEIVPGTPDQLFVALEHAGRVFIVSEKLKIRVPPIPACDKAGDDLKKKADAVDNAFMKGGGKNDKLRDEVDRLNNEADAAVLKCFAGKVDGTPAFKAAEAQAQAIVAELAVK
jgi:hypothetical protein